MRDWKNFPVYPGGGGVWLHGKRFEAQTRLCSSKLKRLKVTHNDNQVKADKSKQTSMSLC